MRSDLSPTYPRHADDLLFRFEVQESDEPPLGTSACNNLDAGLHERLNRERAVPCQFFPWKLMWTLSAVSLSDAEMMTPILLLTLPRKPVLI